jgi:hypothetical protein
LGSIGVVWSSPVARVDEWVATKLAWTSTVAAPYDGLARF